MSSVEEKYCYRKINEKFDQPTKQLCVFAWQSIFFGKTDKTVVVSTFFRQKIEK